MKFKQNSLILVLGVLFTACGGSGGGSSLSTTEKIASRDLVYIMYDYPEDVCTSSYFRNYLETYASAENVVTSVESNYVTCADYGKSNNSLDCVESYYDYGSNKSCVVGADTKKSSYSIDGSEDKMILMDSLQSVSID